MFKQIDTKEGSPFFAAKIKLYLVAENEEKFVQWHSSCSRLDQLDGYKSEIYNLDCSLAPDIIRWSTSTTEQDFACDSSDGDDITTYRLARFYEFTDGAFTASGRPLSEEERKTLFAIARAVTRFNAVETGALYVQMEVDGKQYIWYNEDSCYDFCLLTPEEKAAYAPETKLRQILEEYSIDTSKLAEALDASAEALRNKDDPYFFETAMADIMSGLSDKLKSTLDNTEPAEGDDAAVPETA